MVGSMIVMEYLGLAAGTVLSYGQAAAAFAINFAVSQIVTRVFMDNPERQQDMGVRQQVPPSSVNAIPVVYGDAYMGGTFIDAILTTDQKTMYYVMAVSSISTANATLGTSAGTFNYDMSEMYYGDRLISFSSSGTVLSARVFNGGTGYTVGDVLTISGGSFTTAAVLTVATVGTGGVITSVTLTNAGSYTSSPNNPATVTGGTGTLATFVLKYSVYTNTVTALSDESGNVDTKVNTNLYINLYKSNNAGTITSVNGASAPSVVMGGSDIATNLRWPSTNRQMNNLAFAIVKLIYNRDADTTSLSPITFHVSHYPNGASVAKPGDVWLDYMTNKVYGGAVGWMPDGSFDSSFIDASSATALNTYSDETITFDDYQGNPSTQPRYRINGVLDAGQTVLSNVDRIMSACDSWMTYNAALGQWSVVVNKAETTAYAFDDDNILGEIRVSATDITSSINQVEARFPFKENRDQAAFVNIETPVALLYPNEPVNKYTITYDLVNDSVQANYLANRLLEQAREDLIVSFSTTYYGIQVNAGDVVSVTNSDYGWNAKLFRVMKVNEASLPDGSLGAKLELNEYSAAVYDNFDITQYSPVPNSSLPSVSYFSPLTAPTVTGYPAATVPHFDVQVQVPATGRVTFGNLFYTTSPTPTAGSWLLLATASSANAQPVVNGAYYTFANQVLPYGTYYFAYIVGNDVSQTALSPISASFNWVPTGGVGPTGATGATGQTGSTGSTGSTGATGATGATGTSGTNGNAGLTALTAYLVQSQSAAAPTFTTPTSGATAPSGWSLTAPSVAVGQVMWYIQGRYNSNAVTVDGVGANTTAWTGPIAASIFQDIRSDNWNGSNPPVAGTPATYGTVGYYIKQSSGDMFLNSIYARGVAEFDGYNNAGGTGCAIVINQTGNQNTGGYFNAGTGGKAISANGGTGKIGIWTHGYGGNGLEAYCYGSSAVAIRAEHAFALPALYISNGTIRWGVYDIAAPVGSTSTFLRNDGQWATPSFSGVSSLATSNSSSGLTLSASASTGAVTLSLSGTPSLASDSNALGGYAPSSWTRIFATNSGTANAGGSGINLLGSTSTGIAGAYVGTSGTSNIVTWTIQTTSPSDLKLKEEIADSDLGLTFVKQLRPVSYKLKADPKHQKGYGFVAQEVEALIGDDSSLVYYEPDWQVGDEKGFKTIHYPSYIAVLTKAIQELTAKVEALEAKVK